MTICGFYKLSSAKTNSEVKLLNNNINKAKITIGISDLYSDKKFTKKIGTVTVEQILFDSSETKTTFNLYLKEGTITFTIMSNTSNGRGTTGDKKIGAINFGTGKYLLCTNSNSFSELSYLTDDVRQIKIKSYHCKN